jgi:hypothetical protein
LFYKSNRFFTIVDGEVFIGECLILLLVLNMDAEVVLSLELAKNWDYFIVNDLCSYEGLSFPCLTLTIFYWI